MPERGTNLRSPTFKIDSFTREPAFYRDIHREDLFATVNDAVLEYAKKQ